ncbi:MAG TPA: bacteriohopanetetrol glucosamine biosynthesis glycosyltransferase HpnI [Rhizomicrobium sp.]
MIFFTVLGWLSAALALGGAIYTVLAAIAAGRYAPRSEPAAASPPAATVLKPLHGAEPNLEDNLATFFVQDYPAPFQLVFGVQDEADPAIQVVERLRARYPGVNAALVVDGRRHGSNAKISNLINMQEAARHDVLILSDSDIAVPSDYLGRVATALEPDEVGAVTCLYTGWAGAGVGSRLCAMGIDYQFLPNAVTSIVLGLAEPCFGSTIALKRKVLDEIGGLRAFANFLADDYEIGRAVRARGYHIAFPRLVVRHTCNEKSFGEWLAHELRWARTLRIVTPAGHMSSIVTHAIPLALLGVILTGFTLFALASLVTTVGARAMLKWRIDRLYRCNGGSIWLLPARDVLSFGVFLVSLFGGSVEWQGERLRVKQDGALSEW